jgi:hypothetical protein
MITFHPSLDNAKKYDRTFDKNRVEFRLIEEKFKLCHVFYKLNINPKISYNPGASNWFDVVILDAKKGVVCILFSDSTHTLNQDITYNIISDCEKLIGKDRVGIVKNPTIIDAINEAKKIFIDWDELGTSIADNIIDCIRKTLKLDYLPTASLTHQAYLSDKFLDESVQKYGLIKEIDCAISQLESDSSKTIHLYINTCAGSGKTIAAIYAYQRFTELGKKTLLVGYNHLISNFIKNRCNSINNDNYAGTIYSFAYDNFRAYFASKNIKYPTSYTDHVRKLLNMIKLGKVEISDKYDVLIIDEGQDFLPYWIDLLSHYLEDNSSVIWFEDENQTIARSEYRNSGFNKIPDNSLESIGMMNPRPIISTSNYRSTRSIECFIYEFFNQYPDYAQSKTFAYTRHENNNIQGEKPIINFYKNGNLQKKLGERLNAILSDRNITNQDVAIISCIPYGEEEVIEDLTPIILEKTTNKKPFEYRISQIENHQLKRFSGKYDKEGKKEYKIINGILSESISKLKGMEYSVVLVIDIERPYQFQNHQHAWVQTLYCAFTRAKLRLEIFVDEDGNMNELCHALNEQFVEFS